MTEKTSSDGARRAFDAEAQRGGGATPNSWYEASDSEREQPGWRVPKSTSPEAEREARKGRAAAGGSSDTDTDSDTSAWDTDDESLLENMAIAARRARRVRPGFRRWRRLERGDRARIDGAQRRWDAAMATPPISAKAGSGRLAVTYDESNREPQPASIAGGNTGGDVLEGDQSTCPIEATSSGAGMIG